MKNKLDKIFSEYIRRRNGEFPQCFTCGKSAHWKQMDAGHFMSRRYLSTRWDEKNVQAQCKKCNIFGEGMKYEFGQNLDAKYGAGTAELLKIKSQNLCKMGKFEYEILTKEYKEKLISLS